MKQLVEQFAEALLNECEAVADGQKSAVALYYIAKQVKEMAEEAMKDGRVVEAMKDEVDKAGKGYDFGGFTVTHSVRATYAANLPDAIAAMKAIVAEAEKLSKDAAKKGKPGDVLVTAEGEAYEIPAGEYKSGAHVFTIKQVR